MGRGDGSRVPFSRASAPQKWDGRTVPASPLSPKHKTSGKVELIWTSSNPNVAEVNAKGKVKAVGAGTAKIVVMAPSGKSATCKVTVKVKK